MLDVDKTIQSSTGEIKRRKKGRARRMKVEIRGSLPRGVRFVEHQSAKGHIGLKESSSKRDCSGSTSMIKKERDRPLRLSRWAKKRRNNLSKEDYRG